MIFHHLKYVTPVWYFNLKPLIDHTYFPTVENLKKENIVLDIDMDFVSEEGRQRDLAYRAFQFGFINREPNEQTCCYWEAACLPAEDEYRFLRKNFNPYWSVYVLIIRLFGLNNPFHEVKGYFKSRNSKRQMYYDKPISYETYAKYESVFVKQQPLISIVIPTLNRYLYLKDVFRDLEKQTYKNFEVIIFDQSEPFKQGFYENWNFDLKVIKQDEKALWLARNSAIKMSKGDLILLYDDDSLVDEDWILNHVKCLDYFKCEISSGVSISVVGGKVPKHYSYFRWSDQIDTGNVMLKREVFENIGLFDRQFEGQRMGDGEFGLRAYLAGFKNISNPLAKRIHLKVSEGGLRQMGSWDAWRPKKFFAPRPIPSVLYLVRKYFGPRAAIRDIIISVFPSIVPYRFKRNKKLMILGILLGILLSPLLLISVFRSWHLASIKLSQGSKIEFL